MDSSASLESVDDTTTDQAHVANLQRQLDSLRRIRSVLAGLNSSLGRARTNLTTVNATVEHSEALLNSWTRILNRSEHNQRLIMNANWAGASADVVDAESELRNRQREKQRKEAEEKTRREELERRRAEDEQQRRAATASSAGPRVRVRGVGASRATRGSVSAVGGPPLGSSRGLPTTGRAAAARYGRVRQSRGTSSTRARGRSQP